MMPTGAACSTSTTACFSHGLGRHFGMGSTLTTSMPPGWQPAGGDDQQVFRFSPAAAFKVSDASPWRFAECRQPELGHSFVGGAAPINLPQNSSSVSAQRWVPLQDQSQAAGGPDLGEQDRCFDMEYNHRCGRPASTWIFQPRLPSPGIQAHAGPAGGSRHQAHFLSMM